MSVEEELIREFLLESWEGLNQLDHDFVELERNPTDQARLGAILRCIHTIKGTSGFLALRRLEAVAHAGEGLLSRLRGDMKLDAEKTSALLAMVDAIRHMLTQLEDTGGDGDNDWSALVAHLSALSSVQQAPRVSMLPSAEAPIVAEPSAPTDIAAAVRQRVVVASSTPEAEPVDTASSRGLSVSDATIRVDVGLLDRVMNLVGELVLARNQILQHANTAKDSSFVKASQRLNLLTTELQEGVMKTRMQPIGNVWHKFPRIVRDLAHGCGKQVELVLEGAETELDRTIIEAIKDPLTHAIRNSVDHGIESPERRKATGKAASGTLLLRAFHEGGQVNIEISDDGGGIDAAKVRARAVERGVVSADCAGRMSDHEAVLLIFQPGFSTAEQVTNVSGRGVGMDVVKTNIEKIGGTVDVQTQIGVGTTLKIRIPLTLAIIPALIVMTAGNRFAIPQVNLLELVRLEGDTAKRSIEALHGCWVYRLRGNLLPLVHLHETLELAPSHGRDGVVNIVVLQAGDRQFGLVVDGVNDTEEIVVKPLGKELKSLTAFAGATIMGDGRVALILDVLGLALRANVVSSNRELPVAEAVASGPSHGESKEALLLFRLGEHGRMALPLSMVARLEEVPIDAIEHAAGRPVVQYRGVLLPLVDLREVFGMGGAATCGPSLQVVVYSEKGRSLGFVVDQILDTVETELTIHHRNVRSGVLGSAIVLGRVTDILDVHSVIRDVDPSFFELKVA